ncbi:MAG TPA: MMPL family transporter [Methylomirabilota bacterium]|jgi:predicted RND superfamily exporter protein|nr:MMPL family transporter [Methylomirabilota bacterium]
MADERRTLSAVEEAAQSKAALYRLGAKLIQRRIPVSLISIFFTAIMAYFASGMTMSTSFSDLLPYRHPFVQVHMRFANQFGGANNVNVMLTVKNGDVFTKEVLRKIYDMTQAMDRVTGVNHDQIESIGHRTTRYLTVLGGTIATPPIMRRPPKTDEEVEEIKKICYNTDSVYGQLVSLDGKALLIKANFIEGRLDYKRIFDEIDRTVKEPFETSEHQIWIAGEPRLYGWIYHYATEVYYIFIACTVFCWLLLYFYFHDWRGALRPTITGVTSALWGMGAQALMGFSMDPLALVIPFFITARSVSHSVQMHDRYYEEYHKWNWNKERAIIAAFAELFVPTLSGIITDALGMLAIIVVPVAILQKISISASIWVVSIALSELLLNPIIYFYLKAPEKENVLGREEGPFQRLTTTVAAWVVQPRNSRLIIAFWVIAFFLSLTQVRHLTFGDPTAATPLLRENSPYNQSHLEIQKYFGGIEPLIVVVEGRDKDVLKDPSILRSMEKFQRYMERDPDIGYSFSLADIIQSINMTFYDLQPRWGVIPAEIPKVSSLFFYYFAGAPPGETSRFLDPSYTITRVTFYCRNHQGDNIARIIKEAREFVAQNPMEKADYRLAGGLIGVTAAANEEILKNDILMNVLGFGTIFLIVMFTYRSAIAAFVMMLGLFLANGIVNAYMGYMNMGINLQSLPIVTVGVGFGIDYALYIVSRAVEEYKGDTREAVRLGLATAGKAVTFTAITLVMATTMWAFSNIRFCSEMGLLLALWMAISFLASCTFIPAVLALREWKFFLRAAKEGIVG